MKAMKEKKKSTFDVDDLSAIIEAQMSEIKFAPPLSSVLHKVEEYKEEDSIFESDGGLVVFKQLKKPTHVVIGMDGGSTTTKALISDAETLQIIAEIRSEERRVGKECRSRWSPYH